MIPGSSFRATVGFYLFAAAQVFAADPTRSAARNLACGCAVESAEGSRRLFSVHAAEVEGRVGTSARSDVRRQILVSQGLWPMPTKTPLNAVIHGKIDRGEYTVEKVYLRERARILRHGQSVPPEEHQGQSARAFCSRTGIGRMRGSPSRDDDESAAGNRRRRGAVRAGRAQPLPVDVRATGAHGLRGVAVGHARAIRIRINSPRELVHGFAKQRPEMNTAENWGLYSPQAEAHLQSIMGLQTWNAVRSLDFLLEPAGSRSASASRSPARAAAARRRCCSRRSIRA